MLVLSRKVGESIMIGDGIEVTVTRVSGNRVTLGIKAPADLRIIRKELENVPPPAVHAHGFEGKTEVVTLSPR